MENKEINLCDTCAYHIALCPAKKGYLRFGIGTGGDNVIKCSDFIDIDLSNLIDKVPNGGTNE